MGDDGSQLGNAGIKLTGGTTKWGITLTVTTSFLPGQFPYAGAEDLIVSLPSAMERCC